MGLLTILTTPYANCVISFVHIYSQIPWRRVIVMTMYTELATPSLLLLYRESFPQIFSEIFTQYNSTE